MYYIVAYKCSPAFLEAHVRRLRKHARSYRATSSPTTKTFPSRAKSLARGKKKEECLPADRLHTVASGIDFVCYTHRATRIDGSEVERS